MKNRNAIFPDEENAPWARTKLQAANVVLRLVPLFAKLILTLYMGRYLTLADMGEYGLVFGTVIVLTVFLGQRFDYIVTRELVGADPVTVLHKMRDQALLYLANCIVLGLVIFVLIVTNATEIDRENLVYILILSSLEGYATIVYGNMNSLNRQVLANALFCLRAGVWIFPVVVLGLLNPAFRTDDVVLIGWMAGVVLSLFATGWVWRDMPWRQAMAKPVQWTWLWRGLKKSSLIWLGMVGLTGGVYVDRFIVLRFLGLDDVGIITFYTSFTNAMLALLQSGVAAFAYPRLIQFHRDGNKDHFSKEARRTVKQIALGAAVMAAGLAVAVPLLAHYFSRPVYVQYAFVFWLILAGTWVRANADALFLVLFARNQDRPIWLGNLLFLIPAVGCNALLVPFLGLSGIGYGTIAAAVFLFVWRAWYVFRPSRKHT